MSLKDSTDRYRRHNDMMEARLRDMPSPVTHIADASDTLEDAIARHRAFNDAFEQRLKRRSVPPGAKK